MTTNGALVNEPANNSLASPLALAANTANHFDGNPDWARKQELCDGKSAGVIGTAGPDTLNGFKYNDRIQALNGEDTAKGKKGNDVLCGKGADDVLKGGPGNDDMFGGGGFDRCIGGDGKNEYVKCERIKE